MLWQALQEMPEIMEIPDQILVEEKPEGLDIQIVDQEGRSMFPPGQPYPYERTRMILTKISDVLRELPNRIEITGHTSSDHTEEQPGRTNWDLSVQRANSVRSLFAEYGIPNDRFASVAGKGSVSS